MLDEIVKEAADLLIKQRPEKIEKLQYGQYSSRIIELLYNDGKKEYEQLNSRPENKTVGSVKAFAACIKEELRTEIGRLMTENVRLNQVLREREEAD